MSTNDKKLQISSFLFESNDTDVLMKGIISQGNMSFETELIISQTQLNMVMNQLRNQNTDFELSDHMQTTPSGPDTDLYFAHFEGLTDSFIDLSFVQNIEAIRQIRA